MSKDDRKEPGYDLGSTETNGEYFDTITALVAAGTGSIVLGCGYRTELTLSFVQTMSMKSSFGP